MDIQGSEQENPADVSIKTDSRSEGLILSESHFFNPELEEPVLQSHHLDAHVGRNIENKSDSVKLTNEDLKFDRMFWDLNLYESFIKSDPLTENDNLFSQTIQTSFEDIFCKKCFKTFKRKYAFSKHKCVNDGEKDFQNVNCQQNIYQEEQHSKRYPKSTKEKSVECGVCEKRFSKTNIARHMRLHTGTKTFQCNVCKKRFSDSSNLNVHMRTHTREKLFQCPSCKKKFSLRHHLKGHMRTHSGQNSFYM
ncbi:zinc finger protein 33B [Trichonephila clavipes]|nr:zinc finger protein 33B [Trichonephila clavipes]